MLTSTSPNSIRSSTTIEIVSTMRWGSPCAEFLHKINRGLRLELELIEFHVTRSRELTEFNREIRSGAFRVIKKKKSHHSRHHDLSRPSDQQHLQVIPRRDPQPPSTSPFLPPSIQAIVEKTSFEALFQLSWKLRYSFNRKMLVRTEFVLYLLLVVFCGKCHGFRVLDFL